MRFAAIATIVTAAVAAPFVAAAAGPGMNGEEFIGAVRCTAYESLPQFAGENTDVAWDRARLNAELRNQTDATAERAHAEADIIAQRARAVDSVADAALLREERMAACAGGAMMAGRGDRGAV